MVDLTHLFDDLQRHFWLLDLLNHCFVDFSDEVPVFPDEPRVLEFDLYLSLPVVIVFGFHLGLVLLLAQKYHFLLLALLRQASLLQLVPGGIVSGISCLSWLLLRSVLALLLHLVEFHFIFHNLVRVVPVVGIIIPVEPLQEVKDLFDLVYLLAIKGNKWTLRE